MENNYFIELDKKDDINSKKQNIWGNGKCVENGNETEIGRLSLSYHN